MGGSRLFAQEVITPAEELVVSDSLSLSLSLNLPDSIILNDSLQLDTVPQRANALDAPVTYQAVDSIVMTAGNWAYLYGEGDVKYQQIQLQSEIIEMNLDSSIVYARFGLDSIGDEFGYPLFIDGEQQYESKTMRYNFGSKKGYITSVITQQGEGYVTAGRTKKMEDDVLNMVGGKYTTCDHHDHPHFYIQMTKAKVRPNKNIVTGPVYLVIEDVPLYPLGLPFAFFPFSSSYSSGIIMPTFGDESRRGFNLRDGGYYFAISDYVDLALTGEIYTKGSWGLQAQSSYRKRYKYTGSFNVKYQVTKDGDWIPDLRQGVTSDYSLSKDFSIQWNHSQDQKANPYRSFNASVNFQTASYARNNTNSFYPNQNGTVGDANSNTKSSTINMTQRFANSPFTISGTFSIAQRSRDSTLAVTLPDITVSMSRIYPFKRKNALSKERWYERISMGYTGYFRNSITEKEDRILKANLIKDWRNSVEHTIPINATFNLFNYLNISPTLTYRERWYTSKIEEGYDPQLQTFAPTDTTYGFYRVFDYDAALSFSTTLYGSFKPLAFLGDKVQMIRHRFEPSVSISARPDFGSSQYGYWERYLYTDQYGDKVEHKYSPFAHNGQIPGREGRQGALNFSIDNNIEMKIRSDRDSTGVRKVSLIDKLSMSMSYNMAADSFQWSNLSMGLRLKLSQSYTLNLNATFDTYTYQLNENNNPMRVNIPRWKAGKGIGRLMNTGTSFSYTFNNDTFKKWFGGKDTTTDATAAGQNPDDPLEGPMAEDDTATPATGGRLLGAKQDTGEWDSDGYMITNVPWSLSFSYSLRLNYGDFNRQKMEYDYALTHSLSFNGNVQPTKNWRLSFNATYDFDNKKISYMTCNVTRNMHCFQMTASFVPVGPYKSYSFSVAVSSSLLKDLKYNQSANFRDAQRWY